MRNKILTVAALTAGLLGTSLARAETAATQPSTQPSMTDNQTASYGIGFYAFGSQLKQAGVEFDVDQIIAGIRDSLGNQPSKVTAEQFQTVMVKVQQDMQAHAEAAQKAAGDTNSKAGDAFRAENGKKAGVKTTASGLQIETLKEGTGASPTASDTVKVHYTGKLIDGTTFDSSVDRGQPISFPLNGVIPGWTEGLQLMKVGGKSKLVIPPEIGYGTRGSPPTIPPNATLVFEVELLDIQKK